MFSLLLKDLISDFYFIVTYNYYMVNQHHTDLAQKYDDPPWSRYEALFRWFKKSSCQLLVKECAPSTDKLPRRLSQEQCH